MKIRTGFVSNSSSSSFVCGSCGEAYEGWDGDYGGISEYWCENSHSLCSECFSLDDVPRERLKRFWNSHSHEYEEEARQMIEEDIESLFDYIADDMYEFPEEICPLCNLDSISDRDLMYYLEGKVKMNRNQIEQEIRDKFSSSSEIFDFRLKNVPK